jgi:fucose 4-O-acetylase-like acetyltransferase
MEVIVAFKLKPWFSFTWQISKVVKNHILLRNKVSILAVIFGIFIGTAVTVVHVLTFEDEYVYFPTDARSFIAHEGLFCVLLIFWTAVRNFDIRKSHMATEVSWF